MLRKPQLMESTCCGCRFAPVCLLVREGLSLEFISRVYKPRLPPSYLKLGVSRRTFLMIDAILVPQGTEYKAVCRGVKDSHSASIPIVSFPIGFNKIEGEKAASHLKALNIQRVVMMGLCGSLSREYYVGDIVLYQSCFDPHQQVTLETDQKLTTTIHHHLATVSLVKSLTSDRVISSAQEKQQLYRTYKTDVIDMEGFGYLQLLQDHNIAVAMLRVVSDDARYDIPDLTQAIGDCGQLKTLPLTIAMLKHPLAAIRLIKGSLQGLQILETTVKQLFS